MKLLGCLASALVLAASAPAAAHVRLVYPPPRYPAPASEPFLDPMLKDAPCGIPNDARTTDQSRITTFMAGETITVEFDETIDHPGHFRIAFDDDGQDALVDPDGFDDIRAPGLPIILDGIADREVGAQDSIYQVEITLPNVPCTNCTLQLIQVMTDKEPYGDGDDVYHQCADIVLTGTGSGGAGGSGGTGIVPGGSGGTVPVGGSTGAGGVPVGTGGGATSGGAPTGSGGAPTGSGASSTEPARRPLPDDGCTLSGGGHEGKLGLWAFLALCLSLRRARLRR